MTKRYPLRADSRHARLLWLGLLWLCTAAATPAKVAEDSAPAGPSKASAPVGPGTTAAQTKLSELSFPIAEPVGFIEALFNPMLKEPIQSRGQVWREHDGTLVMELSEPRPEQRRLHGNRLTLSRPKITARVANPAHADAARFKHIDHRLRLQPERAAHMVLLAASALLQGNHHWLQQRFNLSLAAAPQAAAQPLLDVWELLLVPTDSKLREQLPWIRLQGTGTELRSLRADRGAKGWQQLDFFSLER